MQLHHEPTGGIGAPEREQQRGLELLFLIRRRFFAAQTLLEDRLDLRLRRRRIGHGRHAVVGNTAAQCAKIVQSLDQLLFEFAKAPGAAETREIGKVVRLFDPQRLVRAEARQHLDGKALVRSERAMPFETVRRVVGRAKRRDTRAQDQLPRAHIRLRELIVAELPDLLGRIAGERALIAEVAPQLKVAPMIKRISDRKGERLRPLLKLLTVGGVAGDEALLHTGRAHQTPFVVVAAEPYPGDIFKAPILVDLLRIEVAVIVDDRKLFGHIVIEVLRRLRGEQKVLVQKRLHTLTS